MLALCTDRLLHARPWLVAVLLCVLLGAQGLGHLHRLAHGGHSQSHTHSHAPTEHDDAGWGHAADAAECRLHDQLGQDLGPAFAHSLVADALPKAQPASPQARSASLSSRWQRGARAPPSAA
ncbi:hypothetical protein [Roseateles sp.]|jgi:hypothetical protein|uniref:hypothetical protein n=1 Tax=Roseateles sp. TaxID=1971397 RepID=UPI0037C576EC